MVKIFRSYLSCRVAQLVQSFPEQFEQLRQRAPTLEVYSFEQNGRFIFLALRYERRKNWVTCLCAWNKTNRFPGDLENAEDLELLDDLVDGDSLAALRQLDAAVLDPTFFGRTENGWGLEVECAPIATASRLFDSPLMKKKIVSDDLGDWKADDALRDWSLLESYGDEVGVVVLNDSDAEIAWGRAVSQILEVLSKRMMPFLRGVDSGHPPNRKFPTAPRADRRRR